MLKAFLEKAKTIIGAFVHPGVDGGPGGPGTDAVYGDGGGIQPLSAVAPFSLAPLAANGTDNATVTSTADSMLANVKAGNSSGVRAAAPRVLVPCMRCLPVS